MTPRPERFPSATGLDRINADLEAMFTRAVELRGRAYRQSLNNYAAAASNTGRYAGFVDAISVITGRPWHDLHNEIERRYLQSKKEAVSNEH